MVTRKNPLKLNSLQLKTLTLLQEIARHPEMASPVEESGDLMLTHLPHPHGDHFHVGRAVVAARDATGLHNSAVYVALERKGLVKSHYPAAVVLTAAGRAYETGMAEQILHGSDH
ncbi:MAG: hypothetical protein K2Q10_07670 [Rhodospirillales bacterium]|nr:hypothetical protein [Rhodospirillales bacterium]